jgi:hypothetical protein
LRHDYTVLEAIQVEDEFGDTVSLVKIRYVYIWDPLLCCSDSVAIHGVRGAQVVMEIGVVHGLMAPKAGPLL